MRSLLLFLPSIVTIPYTAWNNKKYAQYVAAIFIVSIIVMVIGIIADSLIQDRDTKLAFGLSLIMVTVLLAIPAVSAGIIYSWYFTIKRMAS